MSKDRRIVICDRCGERFDCIPKTCPKCGEILDARMDPDAKRKILEILNPPNKLRPYFFTAYIILCVFSMLLTAFTFVFGVLFIPLLLALIITDKETREKQSILLHITFILFNILISAVCCVLIPVVIFRPSIYDLYIQIFTWCFGIFLIWLIIVIFIEAAREKITALWTINILIMLAFTLLLLLNLILLTIEFSRLGGHNLEVFREQRL